MIKVIKAELADAYAELAKLDNDEPATWNCVGWDGDDSNHYGKDCVRSAIWDSIDELESELADYAE